jgi:cytoskeletal protein CcmA (bactofilin family)
MGMAWGNKGGDTPVSGARGNALSFLGSEVSVKGNISGQGDLHIDGTIEGDVECATLILGASGLIKGNVNAGRATIGGQVEGTVSATELLVEKSARINGDLSYQSVSIETGAQVDGRLSQRPQPGGELKLVAANME